MPGKQVDNTRQELFIALEYLLENCYDSEHTSKTIELTQYALEKHQVNLDRRRANDILEFLANCSNDYPDVLPFVIKKKNDKSRYYIDRALFSKNIVYNKNIINKVAGAIYRDKALSVEKSNSIADIFLKKTCSAQDKEKIENQYIRKQKYYSHANEEASEKFIKMEELVEGKASFYFKPAKSIKLEACTNSRVWRCLRLHPIDTDKHALLDGEYIYARPYSFDNGEDVCLYFPDLNGAAIVNVSNVIIKRGSTTFYRNHDGDFEITDSKYQNIDEFIDKYLNGDANPKEIKFKYVVGFKDDVDNDVIKKIKKAYRDFFRRDMEYTLEEREYIQEGRPDEEPRQIIYIDLHSSVTTSYSAFRKWYWDYNMFEHLVVLEPNTLNNRLLEMYIERFKTRLEKYGETPEQKEERMRAARERREKMMQRIKERRAQRLAQNQAENNNDGGN